LPLPTGAFSATACWWLNIVSSPGAGKTTLLEADRGARNRARIAVVEGDVQTDIDAQRVAGYGAGGADRTNGGCHLKPPRCRSGGPLDLDHVDLLRSRTSATRLPANFDLGEAQWSSPARPGATAARLPRHVPPPRC
jgi:hydrogenase nickel incorporation protein HypB